MNPANQIIFDAYQVVKDPKSGIVNFRDLYHEMRRQLIVLSIKEFHNLIDSAMENWQDKYTFNFGRGSSVVSGVKRYGYLKNGFYWHYLTITK